MANNGFFRVLGLVGLGVAAGGAAAYVCEKTGFGKGGYNPAYQNNDHFENEEVYEEPLDEEEIDDTTEEESVTEF